MYTDHRRGRERYYRMTITAEHHSYVSPASGFNQNSQNLGETAADDRLRWAEEGLEPFDQNTE